MVTDKVAYIGECFNFHSSSVASFLVAWVEHLKMIYWNGLDEADCRPMINKNLHEGQNKKANILKVCDFSGTSNWSADYFLSTGGIGIIFRPAPAAGSEETGGSLDIRQKLANVFQRDWNSEYAARPWSFGSWNNAPLIKSVDVHKFFHVEAKTHKVLMKTCTQIIDCRKLV